MALLDDVASLLEADGVGGGSADWTIRKGAMMPAPENQIAIIETGGYEPFNKPSSADYQGLDYPTFQIMVRAERYDYEAGRAKMQEVYDSLHEGNLGTNYVDCLAIQSAPIFMGFDDDERPAWVINFRTIKAR